MKKMIMLLLLAVGVASFAGCSYYKDTYKGVEAYAKIPEQVPEKVQTKDHNGKVQSGLYSYHYNLTFITIDGDTQQMDYELSDENPTPFEPGSYVKAKISKKRAIEGPNGVSESDVPKDVLEKLK